MFDEDKVQPCEDCGKEYIRENLKEEKSREANHKLFCIRCYNGRKNEKNAETETGEREGSAGQDCPSRTANLGPGSRPMET